MTDPTTIIGIGGTPNLAVDVQPDVDPGSFVVDVSEVDGPALLAWGDEGWTNVVCNVSRVQSARGATRLQGALTRTEAGSLSITLLDHDRLFDPTVNADSVHPGVPVRLRAWSGSNPAAPDWSAVLFTGEIGADYEVAYQRTGSPVVTFVANDVVAPLARWGALGRPDPGVGAGDNLLGRLRRVLAEANMPATVVADDVDTAYAATLASSVLDTGWEHLGAAVDAELGRLWVDVNNRIVTRARGSELAGPVRGTLSDWHGETIFDEGDVHCCYTDPVVRFGTDTLVNRAVGARRVPAPSDGSTPPASAVVQIDDTYSQLRWGNGSPVVHENRSLELSTDAQLAPWAQWLVLHSSTPELRVDSVSPTPPDLDAWRAVLETDIGDRWSFRLHPDVGSTVRATVGVLGIAHEITPDGWTITFLTTEAPTPGDDNPSGWFTVDLSVIDGDDVLAPFGGTGWTV